MHYVYIIASAKDPEKIYVGCSKDLERRIQEHNSGNCFSTNLHRPWKLKAVISLQSQSKAYEFEKYLKTGAGRLLYKRRLI